MLKKIINQAQAKAAIEKAMAHGRLSHAYLFVGEDGVGKSAFAIEMARLINCAAPVHGDPCGKCPGCKKMATLQHPDVRVYFPVQASTNADEIADRLRQKSADLYLNISTPAGNISIDLVREIKRNASYGAVEGNRRIVIITNAERLHPAAENSLLKILEEPPPSMMLILTTTNENALLPTIRSRCQKILFRTLSASEIEKTLVANGRSNQTTAHLVSRLSDGNYAKASQMIESDLEDRRDLVLDFLRCAITGKSQRVSEMVQQIARWKDTAQIREWLLIMSGWFKDLFKLFNLADADAESIRHELINIDRVAELKRFRKNLPTADIEQAIGSVEGAIADLNRKVYVQLVLINLAVHLQHAIRSGSSVSREADRRQVSATKDRL